MPERYRDPPRHPSRCPACGYDLAGLDSPRCPECGGQLAMLFHRQRTTTTFWHPVVALTPTAIMYSVLALSAIQSIVNYGGNEHLGAVFLGVFLLSIALTADGMLLTALIHALRGHRRPDQVTLWTVAMWCSVIAMMLPFALCLLVLGVN